MLNRAIGFPARLLALALAITAGSVSAQVALDPTFANNGAQVLPQSGFWTNMRVMADGRIVTVGIARLDAGAFALAVARFLPSGQPDAAFGAGGLRLLQLPDASFTQGNLQGLLVAADGSMVVCGSTGLPTGSSSLDLIVAALDNRGALDPAFNGTGFVRLPVGRSADYCRDVARAANGGLMLFGYALFGPDANNDDYFAMRLTAAGAVDSSFANGGVARFELTPGGDRAFRALPLPGGSFEFVGFLNDGASGAVFRMLASGAADASFGTQGLVRLPGGAAGTFSLPRFACGPTSNRTIVGTVAGTPTAQTAAVWRLTAAGALDPGFGTGGMTVLPGTTQNSPSWCELTPDGGVLVAGSVDGSLPTADIGLWRLDAAGRPVASFGTGGFARVDTTGTGQVDSAVMGAVFDTSRILLAGGTGGAPALTNFALARINVGAGTFGGPAPDALAVPALAVAAVAALAALFAVFGIAGLARR